MITQQFQRPYACQKMTFHGTSQKRIIFFIGDPALKLAIPQGRVDLTHLNGQ
jgi:hypothetical protein